MAVRITQRLKRVEKGPWLISVAALDALDKVLDDEAARFEASRDAAITEKLGSRATSERVMAEKLRNRVERRVLVTFRGVKTASGSTFAEIMRSTELRDLVPDGFSVHLETVDAKCSLELEQAGMFSSNATLSASSDSDPVRGAYSALDAWLDDHRQAWLIRRIERFAVFLTVLACLSVPFVVTLGAAGSAGRDSGYREGAREVLGDQARELLRAGIRPEDQTRALDLLLRLELANDVRSPHPTSSAWVWATAAGAVIFLMAILALPGVEIAIGSRGRERVKRAAWRVRFVWATVPAIVLTAAFKIVFAAFWKP